MLQSMTGFGTAQGHCDGVEYSVEMRAVNHRYLKISLKLPDVWSSAESDIENLLRGKLHRGSIGLSVRMRISDEHAAYSVNTEAMKKYLDQIKGLITPGEEYLTIDLAVLMNMPGVCSPPRMDDLRERTSDELMNLINQATDNLLDMRACEGKIVQDDLLAQCDQVESSLVVVGSRSPEVVKEYHKRLCERVQGLIGAARIDIDQDYLAREVAVYADRCDINEEISRQNGHLEQFRETCNSDQPVGRKLDFIAQEMLREANTIASKANDTEIARAVVDMKTAVDRIKEQVQNVL
ncbi:MAG: YicC family protein [bacterium]|nr:YicC family protein [bacterium]